MSWRWAWMRMVVLPHVWWVWEWSCQYVICAGKMKETWGDRNISELNHILWLRRQVWFWGKAVSAIRHKSNWLSHVIRRVEWLWMWGWQLMQNLASLAVRTWWIRFSTHGVQQMMNLPIKLLLRNPRRGVSWGYCCSSGLNVGLLPLDTSLCRRWLGLFPIGQKLLRNSFLLSLWSLNMGKRFLLGFAWSSRSGDNHGCVGGRSDKRRVGRWLSD